MPATEMLASKTEDLSQRAEEFLAPNYGSRNLVFEGGEGPWLYTPEGEKYLDFLGGIAVCCLGHCHPRVTEAIKHQAGTLLHTSNFFITEPQTQLAKLLVENSFAEKVFFCNSGGEANEAALKLAKKVAQDKGEADRYEVISLQDSFHGRTIATLSATGQPKLHEGFKPLLPGFTYIPMNDVQAVTEAVTERTCAVIVEPIQGEAGVVPVAEEYLRLLRDLCTEHGALLIVDEIQCGMGRTGRLFAYEHSGIEPDIVTLAKGLANGLPIGAVLAKSEIMEHLSPGSHGSTFGGNPVACAAAHATLSTLLDENFISRVEMLSNHLFGELKVLKADFPKKILEIRGRGLMIGIDIEGAKTVYEKLLERKVIANCIREKTIRLLPPYVIEKSEIDLFISELREILDEAG